MTGSHESQDQHEWPAKSFEAERAHLRAVANRILGSGNEADDAVEEVWLRLSRSDSGAIENMGGWLLTVVARMCLDMLRSRTARREDSLGEYIPDRIAAGVAKANPEQEFLLAGSIGPALLAILDLLSPVLCCMTCSRCGSRKLLPSSAARLPPPDNWQAALAAECKERMTAAT